MDAIEEVHLPLNFRSQYAIVQESHRTRSEDGKQSVHDHVIQLKSWHQRYPLETISRKQTHVVTWTDPPCPVIGNLSRLHMVLYIMNVIDGSAAPRKTIAEYDGKSRDCSIQRNRASGKKGTDRVSLGGGRDG